MKLLQPVETTFPFLKMGLFGNTGSGKTWTASLVAIGLQEYIKSKKPVAFFDTENGVEFIFPNFKAKKIQLCAHRGTSLKALAQVIDDAEQNCSILIIDSISNVWDEFTTAYMKKKKANYIELYDWKPIKKEWNKIFRQRFLNSKLHIILCGREADIYVTQEEERNGKIKKVTIKDGSKMSAEKETSYEPSLLCQMEKIYLEGTAKYARRCNIVKERFGIIDSKTFDNPKFNSFLPHIELLDLGAEHVGIDFESNSENLIPHIETKAPNNMPPKNTQPRNTPKNEIDIKKTGALETLKKNMLLIYPSKSKEDVQGKQNLLKELFGLNSWALVVQKMTTEEIQKAYKRLATVKNGNKDKENIAQAEEIPF